MQQANPRIFRYLVTVLPTDKSSGRDTGALFDFEKQLVKIFQINQPALLISAVLTVLTSPVGNLYRRFHLSCGKSFLFSSFEIRKTLSSIFSTIS